MKGKTKETVRFKCTGCGQCCTGSPGFVWLSEEDIDRFCQRLEISREHFLTRYTRLVNGHRSLTEKGRQYDCIFYDEGRCSVYEARPKQCRTFPFWSSLLESKASWDDAQAMCEGINHPEGKLYTLGGEEIDERS